jgi:hypothetical protein
VPFTDDAIDQAHKLLLKLEEDPHLPELYQRHPGLSGDVARARHDLEAAVHGLTSGTMSRERAREKARWVQEHQVRLEALLAQDCESGA